MTGMEMFTQNLVSGGQKPEILPKGVTSPKVTSHEQIVSGLVDDVSDGRDPRDLRDLRDDPPVPCPSCSCPVQWRAQLTGDWMCYDCRRPPSDLFVVEHRIPILVGKDVWEWETNLERQQENFLED